MVDYDAAGHPICVMFGIETQDGHGVRAPANVEGVRAVFARQKVKSTPGRPSAQPGATSDRIMAQMAIIEAGQVQIDEVFLPYLTDGKAGRCTSSIKADTWRLGMKEGPAMTRKKRLKN